jgi:hypothetical protein
VSYPPTHARVERRVHIDHGGGLGVADVQLFEFLPEDQPKLLEHRERAQLETQFTTMESRVSLLLTLLKPQANTTSHPQPPSGGMKSGSPTLRRRRFGPVESIFTDLLLRSMLTIWQSDPEPISRRFAEGVLHKKRSFAGVN